MLKDDVPRVARFESGFVDVSGIGYSVSDEAVPEGVVWAWDSGIQRELSQVI